MVFSSDERTSVLAALGRDEQSASGFSRLVQGVIGSCEHTPALIPSSGKHTVVVELSSYHSDAEVSHIARSLLRDALALTAAGLLPASLM